MAKSPPQNTGVPNLGADNPFASLVGRMMRETVTMQAEMMAFVSKRVKADIDASHEIMASKNPADAAEVVQRYYQNAFEDYMKQTLRWWRPPAPSPATFMCRTNGGARCRRPARTRNR